jgi:hypothetical protein
MTLSGASPYKPRPIKTRELQIGQWVTRKADPLDVLQIRNVYRHDKRAQLVRAIEDQPPFTVTFAELTRDYRSVTP